MSEISAHVQENAELLRGLPMNGHYVKPDAMIAAAAHVDREYGCSGYSLGIVTGSFLGDGLFEVACSDGSRFRLYADRWGNVERVPDAATV